jgi:PAS domain S-box-containing protein
MDYASRGIAKPDLGASDTDGPTDSAPLPVAESKRQAREFAALLDSTSEGIYGLDAEGRCTFINRAGSDALGYSPEDVVGQIIHLIVHHHRADGAPYPLEDCPTFLALRTGRAVRLEDEVLWRRDGTLFPVLYSASPVTDGERTIGAIVTFSDLSETKRAKADGQRYYQELQYQLQVTKAITDNAASCLFMMDARGHPTFMNLAAERVTGYILDQIKDRPLHDAVHWKYPDGRPYPMEECPIDRASEELSPIPYGEETFVRKDGSFFPVAYSVAPLEWQGQTVGAVIEFRDISAQKLAEAERERLLAREKAARVEAEAAVQARDEFLSIASHELRTPTAVVKGQAQLALRALDRGRLDTARIERTLRQVATAADRLTVLIEDLLDVSHLRQGRLSLHREFVDLVSVARLVVERYAEHEADRDARGGEPRLDLRFDAMPVSIPVEGDRHRLEQVLDNLLSNAIKYSPEGGTIHVRLTVDGSTDGLGLAAPRRALLTVADEGMGLPPGETERIFEPFGRASNAAAESIPGMGLGLYICRQIVEQHGGRLWAESPGEGQGTVFHLWLPPSDAISISDAAAEATQERGTGGLFEELNRA